MTNPKKLGALEYVRQARRKISKQFDHDPQKLVDYYIELQKKYEDRLVGGKVQEVKDNLTRQ
jgi:hypothetical protein